MAKLRGQGSRVKASAASGTAFMALIFVLSFKGFNRITRQGIVQIVSSAVDFKSRY